MICISNAEFVNKLEECGFVISEELTSSVAFLDELNLRDEDKLFLYTEFKTEIGDFIQLLDEEQRQNYLKTVEDKAHELKGVTRNLKLNNLSDVFYKIQLNAADENFRELNDNISEFRKAVTGYFSVI